MKTENAQSAVVRQYLAAVEREAAALPAERRQELVADLAEHIEIALAERPGSSEDILRELGDPRVIVTTALQESGPGAAGAHGATKKAGTGKVARRRAPAWVVASLPAVGFVLGQAEPYTGLGLRIVAFVMLCRSLHWTWDQKWIGLTVTAIVPVLMAVAAYFGCQPDPMPQSVRMPLIVSSVVLMLGGAGWLWKVRKR